MKFLQLNLGKREKAQNLLMQTTKERRALVLLISEQHKWSENSAWYQDTARTNGIFVCSPDLSIRDFLETEARFIWVEMAGVRVYSCYFSPNDPFEIFETQILLLEESLREASGRSLNAGDFNSKPTKWGKVRLERRGILVGKTVARNDLILLNRGRESYVQTRSRESIINHTIAAPHLVSRIDE